MSMTMTLVLLAATNPACALLGFLFGRITRATVDIAESVTEEGTDVPSEQKRKINPITVISVVVVLIGLITAIVGFQVTRNQDRIVGCVVGYSNASADAFERRAAVTGETNDQVEEVFRAIDQAFGDAPGVGRQRVRDAIDQYLDARDNAREVLKRNPLPDAPRDACAELLD